MSQQTHHKAQSEGVSESISALMDGEASELELHRVLKTIDDEHSTERATWARYQMISATMRGDQQAMPESAMAIDLSGVIREAIEKEDIEAPKENWWQRASKLAIAASVAGVVIVTAQVVNNSSVQEPSAALAAQTEEATPIPATSSPALPPSYQPPFSPATARTVSAHDAMPAQQVSQPRYYPVITKAQPVVSSQPPSEEVQMYLQRVMEVHASNAAVNSGRGMMPYAGVPAGTVKPQAK